MFSRLALSSVLTALLGAHALAATLHVPAAYLPIQAAVDAAQPGDTIMIAPGGQGGQTGVEREPTEPDRTSAYGRRQGR